MSRSLSMTASSFGLIAGKVAAMALGFSFWLAAARVAPARELGLAAGTVSAMMLCVQLALLGIGAVFIALYPAHPDRPALLDATISLAAVAGAVAALAFVGVAGLGLDELDVVASSPAYALWFLLATSIGTVGVVLDQISMALGRGDHVLARNTVAGLMTLAPLALFAAMGSAPTSIELFSLWSIGAVGALALATRQLGSSAGLYRYRPRLPFRLARALIQRGLGHYALTCAERLPALVLPVIITEMLSPEINAYWYGIWMMAWAAYVVPVSIGIGLFAEGSQRPQAVKASTAKAIRSAVVLGGAVALVLGLGARWALGALGPAYAVAGVTPLRVLLIGTAPLAIVHAYYAVSRVRMKLGEAIATAAATGAVGIVAVALAGRRSGLTAMALSWLTVQVVSASWSALRLRSLVEAGDSDPQTPTAAFG